MPPHPIAKVRIARCEKRVLEETDMDLELCLLLMAVNFGRGAHAWACLRRFELLRRR